MRKERKWKGNKLTCKEHVNTVTFYIIDIGTGKKGVPRVMNIRD